METLMCIPAFALAVVTILLAAAPAQAQTIYPWCETYFTFSGEQSACGYSSFEQCRANMSAGLGGFCSRNPLYPDVQPQYVAPRKKSRR